MQISRIITLNFFLLQETCRCLELKLREVIAMMWSTNEKEQKRKQQERGRSFAPVVVDKAEDGRTLTTGLSLKATGRESCQVAETTIHGGGMQSMMVPLTPTQMVQMVYGPEEQEEGLEWRLSSSSSSNSVVDDVRGELVAVNLEDIMLRLPPVRIKRQSSEQLEQENNECQVVDLDILPGKKEEEEEEEEEEGGEEEEPCTPKDQPIIVKMPQAPKRPGLLGVFCGTMEYDAGQGSPMCCFEFDEDWGSMGHARFDWD